MASIEGSFALKIDFAKDSENPERVFDSMSKLIVATRATDKSLVRGVHGDIASVLLLEDIEVGSLVSRIRAVLNATDDDALKSGDWKKVVGNYILKAKYAFLEKYPDEVEKIDKPSMRRIQGRIIEVAEQTGAAALPFYHAPSIPEIVDQIDNFQKAVSLLNSNESVHVVSGSQNPIVIPNISGYSKETAISSLMENELSNEVTAILGVKKPDYLGRSKWVFVYDGRSIEAPIKDEKWLQRFQNREIDVRPGDSLCANVEVTTIYGAGSTVLSVRYAVNEVHEVKKEFPEGDLFGYTSTS